MSGKSFVKGAVVLSIAGILAKCLGALYRIPFGTIVSEDCLALYSMVYPIYNLLMALSTAGIPLAISKLVAEYEEQGRSGMSMRTAAAFGSGDLCGPVHLCERPVAGVPCVCRRAGGVEPAGHCTGYDLQLHAGSVPRLFSGSAADGAHSGFSVS